MEDGHQFQPSFFQKHFMSGFLGKNVSLKDAYFLGKSLATVLHHKKEPYIFLANDARPPTINFEREMMRGLIVGGVRALALGSSDTPSLLFAAREIGVGFALMLTTETEISSHIELKIFSANSVIDKNLPEQLRLISANATWLGTDEGKWVGVKTREAYVNHLYARQKIAHTPRIVWDVAHGTAGEAVAMLTKILPGTHIIMKETPETISAGRPDADRQALGHMASTVSAENADWGIRFNIDASLFTLVDRKARTISQERLASALMAHISEGNPTALIALDLLTPPSLLDPENKAIKPYIFGWHPFHEQRSCDPSPDLILSSDGRFYIKGSYTLPEDGFSQALYIIENFPEGIPERAEEEPPLGHFPLWANETPDDFLRVLQERSEQNFTFSSEEEGVIIRSRIYAPANYIRLYFHTPSHAFWFRAYGPDAPVLQGSFHSTLEQTHKTTF